MMKSLARCPLIWSASVIDSQLVLAAFDEQIRRHAQPDTPDGLAEYGDRTTRIIGLAGGWRGVTWSDLDSETADRVIAAEIARFAEQGRTWEWKHYSYDQPADLPDRLRSTGFVPEPEEALMVAEIADLSLDVSSPPGLDLRQVRDQAGVDALVSVHDEVFGGDHSSIGRAVLAGLSSRPRTGAAVVAFAGSVPVSAGRMEFHVGTHFASLWGGGTLPAWRGRGVFRALVAHRASLAAERGYRHLQVDATRDSQPILARLGFALLATTTAFVYGRSLE